MQQLYSFQLRNGNVIMIEINLKSISYGISNNSRMWFFFTFFALYRMNRNRKDHNSKNRCILSTPRIIIFITIFCLFNKTKHQKFKIVLRIVNVIFHIKW